MTTITFRSAREEQQYRAGYGQGFQDWAGHTFSTGAFWCSQRFIEGYTDAIERRAAAVIPFNKE